MCCTTEYCDVVSWVLLYNSTSEADTAGPTGLVLAHPANAAQAMRVVAQAVRSRLPDPRFFICNTSLIDIRLFYDGYLRCSSPTCSTLRIFSFSPRSMR